MKKLLVVLLALLLALSAVTALAEEEPLPELTHPTIMFRQGIVRYIEGDSLYDNCYINGYRDRKSVV